MKLNLNKTSHLLRLGSVSKETKGGWGCALRWAPTKKQPTNEPLICCRFLPNHT